MVKSFPVIVKSFPVIVKSFPAMVKSFPWIVKSIPAIVKIFPAMVKIWPAIVKKGFQFDNLKKFEKSNATYFKLKVRLIIEYLRYVMIIW